MCFSAMPNSTVTDRKNIESQVKNQLLKWDERGGCEKEECVVPRLRTQSAINFNDVCHKAFEKLDLENENLSTHGRNEGHSRTCGRFVIVEADGTYERVCGKASRPVA